MIHLITITTFEQNKLSRLLELYELLQDWTDTSYDDMYHACDITVHYLSCLVQGGILTCIPHPTDHRKKLYRWTSIRPTIYMLREIRNRANN